MTEKEMTPRRRYFMRSSNGDWMDMTDYGRPGGHIDVLTVEVDDDDDYFQQVEKGAGELLGRVVTVHGVPKLMYGDRTLSGTSAEQLAMFVAAGADSPR